MAMANKSRFPWLEKAQEAARRRKYEEREIDRSVLAVMNGAPLSARSGMEIGAQQGGWNGSRLSFTGYGEDGILQPEKPVGLVSTTSGPLMLHEGELQRHGPNGRTDVIPANQLPQDELARMEKERGIPGMQTGGTYQRPRADTRRTATAGNLGTPPPALQSNITNPVTKTAGTLGTTPAGTDITNQPITAAGTQADAAGTQWQRGGKNVTTLGSDRTADPMTLATAGVPTTRIQADTVRTADPVLPATVPQQPDVSTTYGLQRTGETDRDRLIRQTEQERFKGEEQAAMGALQQEMAQMGITGTEALTGQAMARRQIGAQEADVMQGIRVAEAERADAREQRMREEEERWSVRSLDSMLAAGDYEGWANKFGELTGVDIDPTALQDQAARQATAQAFTGMNTYAVQNPEADYNDPTVQTYVADIWKNTAEGRKGTPMPEGWARKTWASAQLASELTNPYNAALWQLTNSDVFDMMSGPEQAVAITMLTDQLTGQAQYDDNGNMIVNNARVNGIMINEAKKENPNADWAAVDTAIANGDTEAASDAYERITGDPLLTEATTPSAGEPGTDGGSGAGEVTYEDFLKTVPVGVSTEDMFGKWSGAGKPTSWAEMQEQSYGPLQEQYGREIPLEDLATWDKVYQGLRHLGGDRRRMKADINDVNAWERDQYLLQMKDLYDLWVGAGKPETATDFYNMPGLKGHIMDIEKRPVSYYK